jgi:mannose-1-phosphate guanylyltransferase/phosphomannomutase
MKAVVMAGGEGSRLRPLTLGRPKPLVPVCNRPIMEHILSLLVRHGITDVVATLHYLGDQIQTYFGDGADFGVQMSYSTEDTPLGTAGSVKQAEEELRDGTFLIISGDALTDCDLTAAIAFHKEKGSLATLVLHHVAHPLDFGVVITDSEGHVERFLEKPGWSEVFSDTVNTGIYILEPEIFDYIPLDEVCDWSQDVFPQLLLLGKPMYGYIMNGYWTDVGSHVQYKEAQEHMLAGKVNLDDFKLGPDAVYMEGNSIVETGAALVPPVCIGQNCKIREGAVIGPYTVIGDNTIVEQAATIERAVLWDSAYVGPNVKVEGALVGSRVTIKRDTVVGEDAVIGDRCLIDVGCVIRPRVKIWPDKVIERGSIVTMSLIWGNKWRGSLFRELGVAGLSNLEITPDFATRLGSAFGSCLPGKAKVITSRDSTRSSRMLKRAIIASLLSVGCDVLDMRSSAVPVARHYIKTSGATGAIHIRKLPGNSRVSLIEMFDSRGAYIPRETQRKIENAFFREDFKRTDPDDLGVIDFASRAIEEYQADFFRLLGAGSDGAQLRIVCDYGFSAVANYFPAMLAKLGVESISINGFNDAKQSPRSPSEVQRHVDNLEQIVKTLQYDLGVLFTDEGERLTVVDCNNGLLSGNTLQAVLCLMVAQTVPSAAICISVTAPSKLEELLRENGATVIRSKSDTASMMNTALDAGVHFACNDHGGFIFPEFHPGYDAAFAIAKLICMLRQRGQRIGEVVDAVPNFQLAYEQVQCPWEEKGKVMRRISEEQPEASRLELLDGIKIFNTEGWVLVLPDAVEPVFHVYAESTDQIGSNQMVSDYARKIQRFALNK